MLRAHAGGSLQQGSGRGRCEGGKTGAGGRLQGGGRCRCSGESSKDEVSGRRWEERGRDMPE